MPNMMSAYQPSAPIPESAVTSTTHQRPVTRGPVPSKSGSQATLALWGSYATTALSSMLSVNAHIGFQSRGIGGCCTRTTFGVPTHDRSPIVQVNITNLVDAVQWYQTVRALRWPEGIICPLVSPKKSSSVVLMIPTLPVSVMSVMAVTGALMI